MPDTNDHSNGQLANIERSIGALQSDVKSILREIARERTDAKESRARVYERVEVVEKDVAIVGQVAAQARDKADANATLISNEIKPQTDRLKNLGIKGGGFLAGAALVGGLASAPLFTTVANAMNKLLNN